MTKEQSACLVCGKPLLFYAAAKRMECQYCRRAWESNASCEDGHYVCDACHAAKGIEAVMNHCLSSKSKNPIHLLQEMMRSPFVYMHGPEHHVMVGAALLTAYRNAGGELNLKEALEEMK